MTKENTNDQIEYNELNVDNALYKTVVPDSYKNRKSWAPENLNELKAAIPGTIIEFFVKEGQEVKADEKVLILEAMKMRNKIVHIQNGRVKKIHAKIGDIVTKGQLLIEFE